MKQHKHIWSVFEEDTRYDYCQICGKKRLAKNIAWKGTTQIWAKTREVPIWQEDGKGMSDNGAFVDKLNDKLDIWFAMKRLTPKQREVCEKVLEGAKQEEIAEELGIARNTVSQRFTRALKTLKQDINPLF